MMVLSVAMVSHGDGDSHVRGTERVFPPGWTGAADGSRGAADPVGTRQTPGPALIAVATSFGEEN